MLRQRKSSLSLKWYPIICLFGSARGGGGHHAGAAAGELVIVRASDYGRDPIKGSLVAADALEIVIRHEDPRAGKVNVHFPRAGFDVTRQ